MATETHIGDRHNIEPEFWVEQKWGSSASDVAHRYSWADYISDHSIRERPFQLKMTQISIAALADATVYSVLAGVLENVYLSLSDLDRLAKNYAKKVSAFPYVKEIGLAKFEGISTIWTIIDSPPFEDAVRLPIYDAQFLVLRAVPEGLSLDFRIINIRETESNQDPKESFPSNMKIIWQEGDVTKAVPHR